MLLTLWQYAQPCVGATQFVIDAINRVKFPTLTSPSTCTFL